ncbi:MAG: hypothetical protein NVSMB17_10320 [Candidatus Dormibacteria bacterium]
MGRAWIAGLGAAAALLVAIQVTPATSTPVMASGWSHSGALAANTSGIPHPQTNTWSADEAKKKLGYLPSNLENYLRNKDRAGQRAGVPAAPLLPADVSGSPVPSPTWEGVRDPAVAPGDNNGAIGPTRYVEIVNEQVGVYDRAGKSLAVASLQTLTGDTHGLSDPVVFWDANTNRFYYVILDVVDYTMRWGFSKTASPGAITDFCPYTADFGYFARVDPVTGQPAPALPDYPKVGQTTDFLLIGVNTYTPAPAGPFTPPNGAQSDLLWISKPQDTGAMAACPPAGAFTGAKHQGMFADLRVGTTQVWTPVPPIQVDPSHSSYVVAGYDVGGTQGNDETGTLPTSTNLYVFKVTPSFDGTPVLGAGQSITVPPYSNPANAPQMGSPFLIDTLDGRLTHAVQAVDPVHAGKTVVWTNHTVLPAAGAGLAAEARWYEIDPEAPSLLQNGAVNDPLLAVFNPSISSDRAVDNAVRRFGGSMVLGFNTSGPNALPAIQMLAKTGGQAASPWVVVHTSPGSYNDFSCLLDPVFTFGFRVACRWGDYAGATPDPKPDVPADATSGAVWLTSNYSGGARASTAGDWHSWNWRAVIPASAPVIPEAPAAVLVPAVGVLVLGLVLRARRRREGRGGIPVD